MGGAGARVEATKDADNTAAAVDVIAVVAPDNGSDGAGTEEDGGDDPADDDGPHRGHGVRRSNNSEQQFNR